MNLCVHYYALDRTAPRTSCTFETGFERGVVAQDGRVARVQEFQKHRPKSDRQPHRRDWLCDTKQLSQEFGTRSMKREHPAIKPKQSAVIAKIGNWRRTAHHRDCADAFRHGPRTCVSVGRASGNREYVKSFELEMVRELSQYRRPVEQSAIRLK